MSTQDRLDPPGAAIDGPQPAKTPKRDVVISEVTSEDLEEITKVFWDAFAPIFPFDKVEPLDRRPSDEVRLARTIRRKAFFTQAPGSVTFKAVDRQTGEVLGFASWTVPDYTQKTHPHLKNDSLIKTEEDRDAWEGVDVPLWNSMWQSWVDYKAEILQGRKHWFLAPLCVKQAAQGQGVGKALINYIITKADAAEPPEIIYLDASKQGQLLYKSVGFEYIGDMSRAFPGMVRWEKGRQTGNGLRP
ncbi:hypothetical protein FRB94_010125 [Tulasnella sp. JGI-2019a]|nr:hypothetical protein FRB94_010125 [Tulasnella sp. JGI-2019a]KAG9018387.1 hypothetical protein FRB93_000090 [Tulasnella sp. JGI-2019a]KAG9037562.1 hypothetical protein FRB95_005144 [Tulasnella sp. JGI-2019a]